MLIFFFILILVLLILVHEFGHFVVAKAFGIKVHEFGIFFPPRIFAKKFGETEYSLNWFPFGGFVKIFGENYDEGKDDPRSFVNKSRSKQAAVIVAGVAFNLLFAWLALTAGYMVGLPTSGQHKGFGAVTNAQATIVNVLPDSPAERAGLMSGDIVEDVQTGTASLFPNSNAAQVTEFIANHQNESIIFMVVRQGKGGEEKAEFLAKPVESLVSGKKAVGIQLDDIGILRLPPHLALLQGAILGWDITASTARGLGSFFKQVVTGTANFAHVAGPIGITVFGAAVIKQGFAAGVVLSAFISINLALINLIPIPGLDGGRLLVIIVEGIRGKRISESLMNRLTLAGFALLILLMLVVSYHDIAKLIG